MQGIVYSVKQTVSLNKFPILTILANVFFGFALGKIFVTPADELGGSILIRAFLIVGACLFANYLLCVRAAFHKGVNRTLTGKLRPFLREALLCAILNGSIFLFSISLFFLKPLIA